MTQRHEDDDAATQGLLGGSSYKWSYITYKMDSSMGNCGQKIPTKPNHGYENHLLTGMIVLLGVCFLHMLVQHPSTGLFSNIITVKSLKLVKTQKLHIEIDIVSVQIDMHTHIS